MANALYSQRQNNALMEHKAFKKPSVSYNRGKVNALATMVSPIPVLGDVAGLAADAAMYAKEPESRNWLNYLMTAAGALPFVPGAAHAIFAGPLAKTADLTALEKAKGMAKLGTPDDQIWRETGWWVNTPDGVPRFEISDATTRINPKRFEEWNDGQFLQKAENEYISNVLPHKRFFEAYPQIDDDYTLRRTEYGARVPSPSGAVMPDFMMVTASAPDKQGLRSSLLHEMQHTVQETEGMARGGSSGDPSLARVKNPEWVRYQEVAQSNPDAQKRDALMKSVDYSRESKAANDLWSNEFQPRLKEIFGPTRGDPGYSDDVVRYRQSPEYEARKQALLDEYNRAMSERFPTLAEVEAITARLRDVGYKFTPPPETLDPYEAYRRLGGEAESRAVQARRDMTIPQRRATPPWESYDVPLNQLIIRR